MNSRAPRVLATVRGLHEFRQKELTSAMLAWQHSIISESRSFFERLNYAINI